MPLAPETTQRILAAIRERVPIMVCPLCHHNNWTVPIEGFALIGLQESLDTLQLGRGLVCVPVTCTTCGNTHLMNIGVLGLGDLLKKEPEKEPEAK